MRITEQQAIDLDIILKTSLENEGVVYSVEVINNQLFRDKNYDYCLNLFYMLESHYPTLLLPKSGATIEYFWANDYSKAFLHNGGFKGLFDEAYQKTAEQEKVDALNLEKLSAEVQIVRFQKGLGKRLSIWGFAIAVISVAASIITTLISSSPQHDLKVNGAPIDTISLYKLIDDLNTRISRLEQQAKSDTIAKK